MQKTFTVYVKWYLGIVMKPHNDISHCIYRTRYREYKCKMRTIEGRHGQWLDRLLPQAIIESCRAGIVASAQGVRRGVRTRGEIWSRRAGRLARWFAVDRPTPYTVRSSKGVNFEAIGSGRSLETEPGKVPTISVSRRR